jgi:hypothetical protein
MFDGCFNDCLVQDRPSPAKRSVPRTQRRLDHLRRLSKGTRRRLSPPVTKLPFAHHRVAVASKL